MTTTDNTQQAIRNARHEVTELERKLAHAQATLRDLERTEREKRTGVPDWVGTLTPIRL